MTRTAMRSYRLRFVSFWIVISLLLAALLVFALVVAPAGAQPVDEQTTLDDLVASMADAVQNGDRAAYLSYVDRSDPIFALEHERWADDWAGPYPVRSYTLDLRDVTVEGDEAHGVLVVTWVLSNSAQRQTASFPVRFTRDETGTWHYAGEDWRTLDTEHFRVRYFDGYEDAAQALAENLPDIYAHVTTSLEHEPSAVTEIKLYDSSAALVANTLLSLPEIQGWNEPGEALKLLAGTGYLPSGYVLAHEFTHFLTFDMADTTHGNYPWWLMEGLAEYVATTYDPDARPADRVERVQQWQAADQLAEWDMISNFETTPVYLWRYVYPQGYVFVSYVTETYGADERNAWIDVMALEMNLDEATEATLDLSFEELDADFLDWLAAQ